VPSPCPSFAEVNEIQLACAAAVHAHSRATLTESVPSPPVTPKLDGDVVAVSWQRVAVGPVVLVVPLLPHAIDSAAAVVAANRRATERVTLEFRYKQRSSHAAQR